jgi:LmbE family N-acetylglucosaminyl deacetylase
MNVLAVGAHHDDIELGCGGTLARMSQEGHTVFGTVLTNSETHYTQRNIHRTSREALGESLEAAKHIGISYINTEIPLKNNGELIYDIVTMRWLEELINKHEITMVFSHWQNDLNTDHAAAARMTVVASRRISRVLMYRSNWYQPHQPFNGIIHMDISMTVNKKKEALYCYKTEIKNRGTEWINTFLDANRIAGFIIEKDYAEVFEPVRYELW